MTLLCSTAHILCDVMHGATGKSLEALNALRCRILGTSYNPNNTRTGAKYLKQSLVGAAMLQYYPPQVNLRSIRAAVPEMPRLMLPEEVQRFKDVDRKKMLGKGPPKKGAFTYFVKLTVR